MADRKRAEVEVVMAEAGKARRRKQSYSDLTIDDLEQIYGINLAGADLFTEVAPIPANEWLIESLNNGKPLAFTSEKARSEFIVAPVLLFVRDLLNESVTIYSGVRFDVDPDNGLKGICDFIVGKAPALPVIQAPVFVMVEAKKNDIEDGLGQCAAEMVAAQIFNQRKGHERTIYGCVTTGEKWLFLQLAGKNLVIDGTRYDISNVEKIVGILAHILSV